MPAGPLHLCPRVVFFATPPVDGSISHYVAIDADFAHSAPSGLTAEQAAMAEPVSVGIWAARKSAVAGGDRVLLEEEFEVLLECSGARPPRLAGSPWWGWAPTP